MGMRFPSISVSKNTILMAAQLVVNVSLAVWLYNEYLHNPFMQVYLANAWSTVWPRIALGVGIAAGAGGVIGFYRTRRLGSIIKDSPSAMTGVGAGASLATLDVCPFCETPLKTLSEGRLQCRTCRRYFKSNLPKVSA